MDHTTDRKTMENDQNQFELILGNSNSRFSGVTSTMLQTLEIQKNLIPLRVLGKHHLPDPNLSISFRELAKIARKPLSNGKLRVFHARRNDEMIQALLLKKLLGAQIKIAFTSTAQRHHSRFSKKLMSKMDAIISTCNAAASYLDEAPDIIIPHGVNTSVYYPAKDRSSAWQQTGLPGNYGIGIFGRVRKQKGVELFVNALIEALPQNPDFTGVVVGEITPDNQTFADELKARVEHSGLSERIVFLGEQPFEEIPKLFRAMSLVCGLSYNEGFGLTVLEALSSGVPVIASEAGAWPDIVNEDVGRLVPAGDQHQVSKAMGELISIPETLDRMGLAGRELILNHYRIEFEAQRLVEFLRSI